MRADKPARLQQRARGDLGRERRSVRRGRLPQRCLRLAQPRQQGLFLRSALAQLPDQAQMWCEGVSPVPACDGGVANGRADVLVQSGMWQG